MVEKSKLERTVAPPIHFVNFMVHNMRQHKYEEFNEKAKKLGMDYPSYISHLMKYEELVDKKVNLE